MSILYLIFSLREKYITATILFTQIIIYSVVKVTEEETRERQQDRIIDVNILFLGEIPSYKCS